MRSEWDKMLAGELYDPFDPPLVAARRRARDLAKAYNDTRDAQLLGELLGSAGPGAWIEPPFFCDYGRNITLGERVYFNFNCIVLDCAPVRIGSHTMFGPAVQILTATHPIDAAERRAGLELARPITVGADVWVGGGAILCPGVTIGARSVIGAGSVVTRDVPADVVAAGNPCRVLRKLSA